MIVIVIRHITSSTYAGKDEDQW